MNGKPQPDWTSADWKCYNHNGLEKSNLPTVSAGALSISFCLVCREVLIRHDNETEAETFVLNGRTYIGFMALLLPQIVAYQVAVLIAALRCVCGAKVSPTDRPVESTRLLALTYRSLLAAIARFEKRSRRHRKPKVGEATVTHISSL